VPILSPTGAASETVVKTPNSWPRLAAIVFGVGVIALPLFMNRLVTATETAAGGRTAEAQAATASPTAPAAPASQAASR
jgi:uncharacterized membrane protein